MVRREWNRRPDSPWPERLFYLLCIVILLGLVLMLFVVLLLVAAAVELIPIFDESWRHFK